MDTKQTIIHIVNAFENDSGSIQTEYDKIYLYKDGPGDIRQVTLGRGYTECGGNLWLVFEKYKELGGNHADVLLAYKGKSGKAVLASDKRFLDLIIESAKDPLFRKAQDLTFDIAYWAKGFTWFTDKGFKLPLSLAVIQDSFLHSGSILPFLTKRFPAPKPVDGGDEKEWTIQYLRTRKDWLANHSSPELRNCVYRPKFFLEQVVDANWGLDKFPIFPNGSKLVG